MDANTAVINQTSMLPVTVWTSIEERKLTSTPVAALTHLDAVGFGTSPAKPITEEGGGVRISPKRMSIGRPYAFPFTGTYLIAIKRGDEHVDIYAVP